jgi:hypothetical protein
VTFWCFASFSVFPFFFRTVSRPFFLVSIA